MPDSTVHGHAVSQGGIEWPILPHASGDPLQYKHYLTRWIETDAGSSSLISALNRELLSADDVLPQRRMMQTSLGTHHEGNGPTLSLRHSLCIKQISSPPTPMTNNGTARSVTFSVQEELGGLPSVLQWLSQGVLPAEAAGPSPRPPTLAQKALDWVLHVSSCDATDTAPTSAASSMGDHLLRTFSCNEFHAPMVVLLFHRTSCVRLWARETLIRVVRHAGKGNDVASCSEASMGEPPSVVAGRCIVALWQLGIDLLCTLKHLSRCGFHIAQTPQELADLSRSEKGTLFFTAGAEAGDLSIIIDGYYSLLVVLSVLDELICSLVSRCKDHGGALAHPGTLLLLGGSIVIQWFFDFAYAVIPSPHHVPDATNNGHDDPLGCGSDTFVTWFPRARAIEENSVISGFRSALLQLVRCLNERVMRDTTLQPSTLSVGVRKSLVKVLVHGLLQLAKTSDFSVSINDIRCTSSTPKVTANERCTLRQMGDLWLFAGALDQPPVSAAATKDATVPTPTLRSVPGTCVAWMLPILLRNARIQFDGEQALQEAKERCTPAPSMHHSRRPLDMRSDLPRKGRALTRAVDGFYALFFTLTETFPELVGSPYFHKILLEYEQDVVSFAIGGLLREHNPRAIKLLSFLFAVDLLSCGIPPTADEFPRRTAPGTCFHRVWATFPQVFRQAVRDGLSAELLMHLLQVLQGFVEAPRASSDWWWLLSDPLTAGPTPIASHVDTFMEKMSETLQVGAGALQGIFGPCSAGAGRFIRSSPLLRLVHVLQYGANKRVQVLGQTLAALLLPSIGTVLNEVSKSDAAVWVLREVLLAQRELKGHNYLQLRNPLVDNIARQQCSAVWLRVLASCNWSDADPVSATGAWWMSALAVDTVVLDPIERDTLLHSVVLKLPQLAKLGNEVIPPRTADPINALCDTDEDEPFDESGRHAQGSKLYRVVRHLLLSLLQKSDLFGPSTFTAALLYVAGALPIARVNADKALQGMASRQLVRAYQQLAEEHQETLKRYAPQWLASAVDGAKRAIDVCLADQNRRFGQFEWEEARLAEAVVLDKARTAEEERRHTANVLMRKHEMSNERAVAEGSSKRSRLETVSYTVPASNPTPRPGLMVAQYKDPWDCAARGKALSANPLSRVPENALPGDATTSNGTTVDSASLATVLYTGLAPSCVQRNIPMCRAETLEEMQNALWYVVGHTAVHSGNPSLDDIIGGRRRCLAVEVPVIPEVFISRTREVDSARAYISIFAPHVAMELRFDIAKSIDEEVASCRESDSVRLTFRGDGPGRENAGVLGGVLPPSQAGLMEDGTSFARQIPVAQTILQQALVVYRTDTVPNDPTDPDRLAFSVAAHAMRNSHVATTQPLAASLSVGDIVLALLPLATVLPAWVKYKKSGSGPSDITLEGVLRDLPSSWKVLGCFPQVCYVWSIPPGQRTVMLCTYPQDHVGQATASHLSTGVPARAGQRACPPIAFAHALHLGFSQSSSQFFLKRIGSANPSLSTVAALHDISRSHFSGILYNPQAAAKVSAEYVARFTAHCSQAGVMDELRNRLCLQEKLNKWQIMAVAAVLYAVQPGWVHRGASATEIVATPAPGAVHCTNNVARESFFKPSPPSSFPGAAPVPDVLIIEGPPGTGKTQTIAALVLNILPHLAHNRRVLLCAPSNCAVDEALMRVRLLLPIATRESGLRHPLDIVRLGVRENVDKTVLAASPSLFLDDKIDVFLHTTHTVDGAPRPRRGAGDPQDRSRWNSARESILSQAALIFSTLGSLNQLLRQRLHFDVVIVDEASQGTEPDVLTALSLSKRKCVLVGDSKQLQPTVLCHTAASHGLKRSLLVRLLRSGYSALLLRTQYRMHRDICAFPNQYFYKNQLLTDRSVHARRHQDGNGISQKLGNLPRFAFVDVPDSVMTRSRGLSAVNAQEAAALVQAMRSLRHDLGFSVHGFARHVGIITYYRAQRDKIIHLLTREERSSGLQVATVDSFQGKERDIIFISCVRTLGVPPGAPRTSIGVLEHRRHSHTSGGGGMLGLDEDLPLIEGDHVEEPMTYSDKQTRQDAVSPTLGFLSDWHRINVSLTRAKELCVMFGSRNTIQAIGDVHLAAMSNSSSSESSCVVEDSRRAAVYVDTPRKEVLHSLRQDGDDPMTLYRVVQHADRCASAEAFATEVEDVAITSGDTLTAAACITYRHSFRLIDELRCYGRRK